MLRVYYGFDPLLPRPFAIYQTWQEEDQRGIDILYKVVGQVTKLMTSLQEGDSVYLLGPLGRGFSIPAKIRRVMLIAGGIGVSPLLNLSHFLLQYFTPSPKLSLLFGSKGREDLLLLKEFSKLPIPIHVATEDGTVGHKGVVTDLLPLVIPQQKPEIIYASGPEAMLKEVGQWANQYKISCQVSLERLMACGIGACLSCVAKTKTAPANSLGALNSSPYQYKRTCLDGPVFDAQELIWDNENRK
jgi:dihydroorotate dehydrogenase electron transfer subunit